MPLSLYKVQSCLLNREAKSMSAYPLDLSADLLEEAQKLADENQTTLKQWLISAINVKIAAEKTRLLLQSYAQNADYAKFDALLAGVPDVPPVEGDEI